MVFLVVGLLLGPLSQVVKVNVHVFSRYVPTYGSSRHLLEWEYVSWGSPKLYPLVGSRS